MKKLFLLASLAVVFASCEKEVQVPVKTDPGHVMKQQIAAIIGKADPELYDRLYVHPSERAPKPTIKVTHGIFHIPPPPYGAADGTCLPCSSCICHLTIVFPALVDENTEEEIVVRDETIIAEYKGDVEVILNDSIPRSYDDVDTVRITFGENDSKISCTQFPE